MKPGTSRWTAVAPLLLALSAACDGERALIGSPKADNPEKSVVARTDDWSRLSVDVAVEVTLEDARRRGVPAAMNAEYTLVRERRADGVWRTVLSKPFSSVEDMVAGRRSGDLRLVVSDDGSERRFMGANDRVVDVGSLLRGAKAAPILRSTPESFGAFKTVARIPAPARGSGASAPSLGKWSDNVYVDSAPGNVFWLACVPIWRPPHAL